jgi:hypothetical protein
VRCAAHSKRGRQKAASCHFALNGIPAIQPHFELCCSPSLNGRKAQNKRHTPNETAFDFDLLPLLTRRATEKNQGKMAGAILGISGRTPLYADPYFLSSAVQPQAELSGIMLLPTFRERKVGPTEGENVWEV